MKLLSEGSTNAKTAKNSKFGKYLSYILYLSPSRSSGTNVCPMASKGCIAACLNTAGRGAFNSVQAARMRKTKLLVHNRDEFMNQLHSDLCKVVRKAAKLKLKAVVRLNGTSDLDWFPIIQQYPEIQFYDYTKVLVRLKTKQLKNYHLTFSRSEVNEKACYEALARGFNVAVVFKAPAKVYAERETIDGDQHDLRFLDKSSSTGLIVALKAKGKARKDQSGFVVDV